MSSYGSWSVKGIDDRARAVAKEKARLEGITLGDYINNLLLEGHSESGPRDMDHFRQTDHLSHRPAPRPTRSYAGEPHHHIDPAAPPSAIDSLTRRIEAAEARSTLAITGIDQSVLGLLARLERTEHSSSAIAADVETMIDELRETHEALQSKVRDIEADDTTHESLQAMKALELALGKLATHVYEENSLVQDETTAIKGRIEVGFTDLSDRVEGMEFKVESTLANAAKRVEKAVEQSELRAEGTSRHLSERFSAIESGVATKLAKVEDVDRRMSSVEGDVSGAITSMEGTLVRIQDRLNRAENTTDAALKALEHTFASLDDRIDTVAMHTNPERAEAMRKQLEQRFDDLAADLRASVEESRAQLASEIEQAAAGENPQLVGHLNSTIDTLKERLASGEEQLGRIATGLDTRLRNVETRDDGALEQITLQMGTLADRVDERVAESEQRSASAIEQVGEQVATAIGRVQARQDASTRELTATITDENEQQDARLSRALANISERLADMQTQTVSVMSPVQKAMASLARRLEAIEDFNAPPHAVLQPSDPIIEDPVEFAAKPEALISDPEPIESDLEDIESLEAEINRTTDTSDDEDGDFIAGLPELAKPATGLDKHFAEFDQPVKDAVPVDEDYTAKANEIDEDLIAQIQAQADNDPLAQIEAELSTGTDAGLETWDDGHDEARDSDIFADDFSDFTEDTVFAEASADQEQDFLAEDPSEDEMAELEIDDDATDYLARARRAAISAAVSNAGTDSKRSRPTVSARPASQAQKSGSKRPVIAAASALVLATAGASALVMLRGKQDKPAQPISVASISPAATATPVTAVPPTLDGVDYDEANAALDTELFDDQGSAAPNSSEPVLPTPIPVVERAPLPIIPKSLTLEEASADGDPIAEYMWAQARLNANDFSEGPEFVRRAALQGLPVAQYRLAKLHEKGLGVPRDLNLARSWTEKAARGGNVKAMHDLAVFFADGEGGPQSFAGAAEWFRQAADYGLVDSQYNLAVLYENGLGISPSKTEALYWYEIAAANGDASAPGDVTKLRSRLALEEAQTAQRRASSWTPTAIPAAANGTFGLQDWQNGSRAQVYAIQTVLNGLSYNVGSPDGLAGIGTRAAIREYQSNAGLLADGQITDELVDALNRQAQSAA